MDYEQLMDIIRTRYMGIRNNYRDIELDYLLLNFKHKKLIMDSILTPGLNDMYLCMHTGFLKYRGIPVILSPEVPEADITFVINPLKFNF